MIICIHHVYWHNRLKHMFKYKRVLTDLLILTLHMYKVLCIKLNSDFFISLSFSFRDLSIADGFNSIFYCTLLTDWFVYFFKWKKKTSSWATEGFLNKMLGNPKMIRTILFLLCNVILRRNFMLKTTVNLKKT